MGDVKYLFVLTKNISFHAVQILKAAFLGMLNMVFDLGLWKFTGITGMISGTAFLTVAPALPGLVVFTIFEIFQLALLH